MTVLDAGRFLKENFDFIKNNSLEGCPSALAWLPENSEIWTTYGSRMDCPWKLCWGRRKSWSLCEAVLHHSGYVNSAAFSRDGMHIVCASSDHTVWIWNTITGECEAELKGHSDCVNSAVFSPDGMHIVSASNDKTAWIWNATTGECEAELKGHSHRVNSAVFSPDGMHIVSASFDKTARIWNTTTGECEAELKGHSHWIKSAVFSPDGMHIVSASDDKTVRIWNTTTRECEAELKGHSDYVNSAVFSPDGIHIIFACQNNTVQIWNMATEEYEEEMSALPTHTSLLSLSDNSTSPTASSIPIGVFIHHDHNSQIQVSLESSFLDVYKDIIFHTKNLHKIWIPPPFCKPSPIGYHLSKICLGYRSGQVLLLEVCMVLILYSTL